MCYENELTRLNLGSASQLTQLWCYGNKLTELDATQHPNLTKLSCFANKLTSLNLSFCPNLQELSCFLNNIGEIILQDNKMLVTLSCFSNQIKGEKMTELAKSLSDAPEFFNAKLFVICTKDPNEKNICLTSDVAIAKSKHWTVGDYDLNNDTYVDYGGSEVGVYSPAPQDFKVYPNPASDCVILSGFAYGANVTLCDLSGRALRTCRIVAEESRLNVSDLPRGAYLLISTEGVQSLILQ